MCLKNIATKKNEINIDKEIKCDIINENKESEEIW